MAPRVVLDTSVVLKWFRQGEALADRALALRTAYLDEQIQITVPFLLAYELASVLRYKGDPETARVQDAVTSLFDMGLEWVAPTERTMRRGVFLARECDLTLYDAAFVVLAEASDATLISADERLVRRLETRPFVRLLGDASTG
jgi:predicted nucleic acid-binding protein